MQRQRNTAHIPRLTEDYYTSAIKMIRSKAAKENAESVKEGQSMTHRETYPYRESAEGTGTGGRGSLLRLLFC